MDVYQDSLGRVGGGSGCRGHGFEDGKLHCLECRTGSTMLKYTPRNPIATSGRSIGMTSREEIRRSFAGSTVSKTQLWRLKSSAPFDLWIRSVIKWVFSATVIDGQSIQRKVASGITGVSEGT